MNASQVYILISVVGVLLVVLAAIVIVRRGPTGRLTPLAGLAFAFVIAGVLFGENRYLGYGLMGIGVVVAIIDAFQRSRVGGG